MTEPSAPTPAQVLEILREGNRRFATNAPSLADRSPQRRAALQGGQSPHTAVLCCSDSRVPPEIVFDQGLGELFVVRTAGHVVDDVALGSLEYAVEHLHVPLILVLGHDGCGAVTSACSPEHEGTPAPLARVLQALEPAVRAAAAGLASTRQAQDAHALVDLAVRTNIELVVERLRADEVIARVLAEGTLRVAGARYDLGSGLVHFL